MASAVAEEYLETIYNMAMEGEPVIAARLADKFGVSRPTVSETVKRLLADGYVEQAPDRTLALTPAGKKLTEQVLRRHRLAERLMFDVLGMDWISAHEQAHALEHWISDEVEQRISELLHHPTTCPHGNPIPGNATSGDAFLREQNAFRLTEGKQGQTVHVILISELVEDESETLRRLNDKHIHPRSALSITRNEPGVDVVFETHGETHSIPADLACKIWVNDAGAVASGSVA